MTTTKIFMTMTTMTMTTMTTKTMMMTTMMTTTTTMMTMIVIKEEEEAPVPADPEAVTVAEAVLRGHQAEARQVHEEVAGAPEDEVHLQGEVEALLPEEAVVLLQAHEEAVIPEEVHLQEEAEAAHLVHVEVRVLHQEEEAGIPAALILLNGDSLQCLKLNEQE